MKMKEKFPRILVFALSLLLVTGVGTPASQASVESIKGFGNDAQEFGNMLLDNIEELVIKSGLPDLKKKVWKEYGLLIKPYFKSRYTLTSNVFKAPDTDSDHTDNIFSFIPGVQLVYKMPMGVVGAAYEATFNYFAQFEKQNQQNQNFLVYSNLFPTDDTYVRISNRLRQEGITAGSSAFKPVDVKDNTVNITAGYKINDKWTVELGYENYDHDFANSVADFYDYNENKMDPRIYYQINENHRAYTGMRIGWIDFGNNSSRDTVYWEIPVGLEGKLPWGVNYTAAIGIHHRNLENGDRNDITHVVTNIALEKKFNDGKTQVSGGFYRRDIESSFSSATTYDEKMWYANVKHLITSDLRGRAGIYFGNRDFEERIITSQRVVILGRVFAINPVSQVKRDDDVFGFNLGFDYNVRKWLILHMDYAYNRRDSNISQLDYTENVFSLASTIPL